ncbi:hypothetical protein NDU88_001013 [Pleurodeles waltl]|uniref:DDE Tnp4 domain-containing protein n=1 Tax=Pleurodeles waltl TaxID=8319 RepID=A0AAV7VY80_PLEWA|nr:hypothetical protein NDU88_001013 [Pleurodeles waltl]
METYPAYRPLVDLATLEDRHIILTYRLDMSTITELCAQLEPDLISAIFTPMGSPLLCKCYQCSISCQMSVDLAARMSQPMFSILLTIVLSALIKHMCSYIAFPQVENLGTVKAGFYTIGHIRNIIGVIDGTYIAFVPPAITNRCSGILRVSTLNVQMVCLADRYISHVNAKYPESEHDAFVLRNNSIPNVMGQLQKHRVWLIGEPWFQPSMCGCMSMLLAI